MSDEGLDVKLNEVWRACRNIQAAVHRHGLNISAELAQFDPNNSGFIPESKFLGVLGGYKQIMGISDNEIHEVTDYFRTPDGRIAFKEFCRVVCEDDHTKNCNSTHELEHADPMRVNPVTNDEKLELCTLLTKIARSTILPLLPYFQDYEMVTGNVGTVNVSHFSRVLHFMRFQLSEKDLLLLLKRYMKDSYTVNYVAFVAHVDAIADFLREKSSDVVTNHPVGVIGRIIGLELAEQTFPTTEQRNKHQRAVDLRDRPDAVGDAIFRIQRYVYENRIRLTEFLESFDALRTGIITRNQFLRGLDNAGISGGSRLKLSQGEIELICGRYADRDHIMWKEFVDEIDRVFTEKNLEKQPQLAVESPLPHIKTMPKFGQKNWQMQDESVRDLCEETLARIQKKVLQRRIYLLPFFKNFDKLNKGHIRPNQAFQALLSNTILVSQEEFDALAKRYSNDLGFNYMQFLEEADPPEYAIPKLKDPVPLEEVKRREEHIRTDAQPTEQDIINALSNAKRQSQVNNVKLIDFFVDYDHHRENQILDTDFRRSLDTANIKLTVPEVDVICNVFRSPHRGCTVRYRDFCKVLDEIFIQGQSGEKISTPIKHFPCVDCTQCFLNFEERTVASKALQKLSRKPDQISNLQSLFKDFDKSNCGTITQNQFLRALTVRDMHNMISSREFEIVCKCFGYERGKSKLRIQSVSEVSTVKLSKEEF